MAGRDLIRISLILKDLEQLWHQHPDLRFFQLIQYVAGLQDLDDIFYMEDSETRQLIQDLLID